MTEKTITGVLHSVTDGTFYIAAEDGQKTILIFDGEHSTPIQMKITLDVYRGDDGEWHVNPAGTYYTVADERPRPGPPGIEKKHIALFRKVAVGASEEAEAKELKAKGYEPVLTNTRWLLLKRPENLSQKQEPRLAELLPLPMVEKQALLETTDPLERLRRLAGLLHTGD